MDFQGALKEFIVPAGSVPQNYQVVKSGKMEPLRRKLRQRHKLVISLHMAGFQNDEIARELGYTPGRVSTILHSNHPELQSYKVSVENQVAEQIGDLTLAFRSESAKSLKTLVRIRDNENVPASEQRLSAIAILDRAGYSPVKKIANMNMDVPVSELNGILGRIDDANQVAIRQAEWAITEVKK